MALSTLLLPSSSSTDTSDRRHGQQQQHHHHSRRKKKPPAPPPLSPVPRTPPPPAASRCVTSKKSPALASPTGAKLVAGKDRRRGRSGSKKAAATASSWEQLKSLLSCRSATAAARVHDPAALARGSGPGGYWCASLCSMRDVATVDGASSASSVVDHGDTAPLNRSSRRAHRVAASSSTGAGHPSSVRGLSGCYECRAINIEPMSLSRRYPRPRELCPCLQCGEVFTKAESLEQHQAIRHAVSELGPEDSGRNIVEIIFKSSWQKRDRPICHIDCILKVHNPARTVARFEAYRDAVRARCRADVSAGGGATRAAADGNELLRFHPAALACALGADGSTSLCASGAAEGDNVESAVAKCGVCAAIRHGFAPWAGAHPLGVRTVARSGRAHDVCGAEAVAGAGWRAMLVCRVIAGQVRRQDGDGDGDGEQDQEEAGPFDSVAGDDSGGAYGILEELFVANPRAILPCFVVVYRVDVDAQ